MELARLNTEPLRQGVEWIARGSLIALVTGAVMRDVLIGQTAAKVLFAEPGVTHLALAGVATTAIIAGSSAYRSKVRYIPETVAVDLFGSMVAGWCLAKAVVQGKLAWQVLSDQFYTGDIFSLLETEKTRALHNFCWASCRGSTLVSAALGIGGGALAFSRAVRNREPWAIDWEQECHDLWASLLGLKKNPISLFSFLGRVFDTLPFTGWQYRVSDRIAPPPSQTDEVARWINSIERVGARAAYYLIWGGLHTMAFRAAPTCYGFGLGIGLFTNSSPQVGFFRNFQNRYFSFFEGGGAAFAERSYRDRFFYFACLFFGAVVLNHAFVQPIETILPIALGDIAAQQSRSAVRSWRNS
jgi:hypothetical protein